MKTEDTSDPFDGLPEGRQWRAQQLEERAIRDLLLAADRLRAARREKARAQAALERQIREELAAGREEPMLPEES